MANEFFPYRYQDNPITLKINGVFVDGVSRLDLMRPDLAVIDLTVLPNWAAVELPLEVRISSQMAQAVLPPVEQSVRPWRVVVTSASLTQGGRQIGWRQSKQLMTVDENKLNWTGSVHFLRDDVGTAVRLKAFVTRSSPLTQGQLGFADEPGLRMGASEEWIVQIDPKSIPPGKSMRVEWVHFATCDKPHLNQVADSLYYLDLDQDFPVLYLNEDIPDLKTVLENESHIGSRAAIRDTIFRSIAQPVWLALTLHAASTPAEDGNERPEWQQSVLKHMAPRIYHGESEEAAVENLARDGRDPNAQTVLLQRLIPAVQQYLDLKKSTSRLFRDALHN